MYPIVQLLEVIYSVGPRSYTLSCSSYGAKSEDVRCDQTREVGSKEAESIWLCKLLATLKLRGTVSYAQ